MSKMIRYLNAIALLLLLAGQAHGQSRGNLQYYTNGLAISPTNTIRANVLPGTNMHSTIGPQGQVTLHSALDTNLFQPVSAMLSALSQTGALTNQSELDAKQSGSIVLSNAVETGFLTNRMGVVAPLALVTNAAGTILFSNHVASSIFSDSWTPISDDTNTVGWWRSYSGVTYDSASNVTEVADSSGYGRPFKQTIAGDYPFYLTNGLTGGRASLVFDGGNDWLKTDPFPFEQPATIYFLYKGRTWIDGRRYYGGLAAAGGTATNAFIYAASSEAYLFHRSGGKVGNGINHLPTGNWGTLRAVWDGPSSKLNYNGRAMHGGDPGGGGFGGMVISGTDLGALGANIEWGEMIARSGTDTDDRTLKTMRYLQRASGQKFNLVVLDGNSLTAGTGLGPASLIPHHVATNYWPTSREWFTKNAAVGGDTTSNMIVRASATDRFYHPNNSTNILTAWEISNELFYGLSTNAVYSNFVYYCQARRAIGWKVIALTVLPRTGGTPPASFETDRLNVNLMIRANYLSFADALADVGTNGFLGCTGCSATNTYFSDGTHLTEAGNKIVGQYITNAISRLDAGVVPLTITQTNTLYQTNGVNLGSSGTLNIVPGSNTVVHATNAAGVTHLQINAASGSGGSSPTTVQGDLIVRGVSVDERLGLSPVPGATLTSDGTNVVWANRYQYMRFFDDFDGYTITNGSWRVSNVAAGYSDNGAESPTDDRHGTLEQKIVTGTTDRTAIMLGHPLNYWWFSNGPVYWSASVYLPRLSTVGVPYIWRFGLGDLFGSAPNDGAYFEHASPTAEWKCVTANNGATTSSTSLSNVLAETWTHVSFRGNSNGTAVVFYVGTSHENAYPVATNITNIPITKDRGSVLFFQFQANGGTTTTTNIVDYVNFEKYLTTPR